MPMVHAHTFDLYTHDGNLITRNAQRRFAERCQGIRVPITEALGPDYAVRLPVEVPNLHWDGDRTSSKLIYDPVSRQHYVALERVNDHVVSTVLNYWMKIEPEVHEAAHKARGAAIRSAVTCPSERRWHFAELQPDFDGNEYSMLVAYTFGIHGYQRTRLGFVPLRIDTSSVGSRLMLDDVDYRQCLKVFQANRALVSRSVAVSLYLRSPQGFRVEIDLAPEFGDPFELAGVGRPPAWASGPKPIGT